jgi:hypothetical protein
VQEGCKAPPVQPCLGLLPRGPSWDLTLLARTSRGALLGSGRRFPQPGGSLGSGSLVSDAPLSFLFPSLPRFTNPWPAGPSFARRCHYEPRRSRAPVQIPPFEMSPPRTRRVPLQSPPPKLRQPRPRLHVQHRCHRVLKV